MALSNEEKAAWLARVPLFAGVSADSMNKLADATGEQSFSAGQFVVRQGQVGTGLYVIVDGSVEVVRGDDVLATLGPGEFFGEMSVMDQQPRFASVRATQTTRVLAIASWDFLGLLEGDPKMSLNVIRGLVERIRATGEQHRH